MIHREELVMIGRYNKPHGVKGELSATFECAPDDAMRLSCLVSEIDGIFVPFFVEQSRGKTGSTALLVIDGLTSESEASLLTNRRIYALRSEWNAVVGESDDDLPASNLIGFDVTVNGRKGTLTDINDATANVLLIVELDDGKEIMVPAVDEMIDDIDTPARHITLNVPPELFELNT